MKTEFYYQNNINETLDWLKSLNPIVKYKLKATVDNGKRTLDQNATAHVWYSQIANEIKDDDLQGWERYCKLHHGIPILRASDEEFRAFYDLAIKQSLTYEQKLKAMDFTPVTRLMNKAQFNQYFEALQDDFLKRGVLLEFLNRE